MKSKQQNVRNANKRKDYFADDNECCDCLYYKGKIRGCSLTACSCEDIKPDARKNGKIKQKRG